MSGPTAEAHPDVAAVRLELAAARDLRLRAMACPHFTREGCGCQFGRCLAGKGGLLGKLYHDDCRACLDEPEGPWRDWTI